jgi:hypothetical protein
VNFVYGTLSANQKDLPAEAEYLSGSFADTGYISTALTKFILAPPKKKFESEVLSS